MKKAAMGAITGFAVAGCVLATGAVAAPLPFTVDPTGIPGITGYSPFTATDLQGTSADLIQQIGLTTQFDQGWIEGSAFVNGGTPLSTAITGLSLTPGTPNTYNIYALFKATVNGITGFGAGQSGTVAAGGFEFVLYADPTAKDVFNAPAVNSTGGTPPTVTDNTGTNDGIANDIVLAYGSSLSGTAGFAPSTGAPFFDVITTFTLCNGTNNGQGNSIDTCGSFNAANVFTVPVPFYQFAFTSTISGSAQNLTTGGTNPPNATLTGVVSDTNFLVPEPASIALLGGGLTFFGIFSRRRRKSAA